jgi:hypothetical protein
VTIQLPELAHSLQGRDLGHLRIVAGLWGVELNAPDAHIGLQRLAPALLDPKRVSGILGALPEAARQALDDLAQNGGYLPWAHFSRRHGTIREMGSGRRDRERPYLDPASPAETLWYRALLARAFFDTGSGPEEHAYIPADLLSLIEAVRASSRPAAAPARLGRAATPNERARAFPASDRLLDHAVTLLAALRIGEPQLVEGLAEFRFEADLTPPLTAKILEQFLGSARLLDEGGVPHAERTRAFLEAPRGEALALLASAWLESTEFNELRQLPGLICEGDWQNDPASARRTILDFIRRLHQQAGGGKSGATGGEKAPARAGSGPFWSLAAFTNAIRQTQPDYQRPAGDYDSWYIRRSPVKGEIEEGEPEFLRGFEYWDEIDGALIRYLISGPMYWLGMVELAAPERAAAGPAARAAEEAPGAGRLAHTGITAFRLSRWAEELLQGSAPRGAPVELGAVLANSDGRLRLPRQVPRAARYQIARFCRWVGPHDGSEDVYQYSLSPSTLERARQGGLRAGHLLALLRRYAPTVPPPLARALERWEERGAEAHLERLTVLRLSSPELLNTLRTSRAARFLGDPLGPTAVVVKPGAWEKVQAFLAEIGYLAEVSLEREEGRGK